MGAGQRRKGNRIENEIVHRFLEIGIHAERVPLSGASKYRDNGADVDIYLCGPKDSAEAPLVAEVKARKDGRGFTTLENWIGDADLLVLRRDRADPLVALPWSTLVRIAKKLQQCHVEQPSHRRPRLVAICEKPAPDAGESDAETQEGQANGARTSISAR